MKTVKDGFECAVMAALIAVLCFGCALLRDASTFVKAQKQVEIQLVSDLNTQMNTLRSDASHQITSTRTQILGEVSAWRSTSDSQLTAWRGATETQIAETRGTVVALGDKLDPVLTAYTKLGDEATATLKPVQNIAETVSEALPPFTTCEYLDETGEIVGGNPDCVFNRFQGVSKAAEQMFQEGAKAAPELATASVSVGKSVAGIAGSVDNEAKEFTKPQTTRQKITMWLGLLPRIALKVL